MTELLRLGPAITQWDSIDEQIEARVAGTRLNVYYQKDKHLPLKFQYLYWKFEDGNVLHWYIPMPQGEELRRVLLDIAKHEGIDLSGYT